MAMKLFWSSRSPFVRKVMVVMYEAGVADRVKCRATVVSATETDAELSSVNPLGQIPTLVLDDGSALYDSTVICEYLDGLHEGPKLFPAAGPARMDALRRHALGDGMMETLVRWLGQQRRYPDSSHELIRAYRRKLATVLDALEAAVPDSPPQSLDIGDVAIGCALSYLDFRFARENWRQARPALARWYAGFAERPSVKATTLMVLPRADAEQDLGAGA